MVLTAAGGVLWLRGAEKAALPVLDADQHIEGISAPVVIRRDGHGVPHIEASSQDDLFMAQGYVTAQDRLWQMDTFRRNAYGELAELIGPALVPHDRMQRVLQFRKIAARIYANLDPADKARLDDYARGVNSFIAQHQDSMPAEFRLLAYRPQPWTGEDSIVVGLSMEQTLDTHWDTKLVRELIAAKLQNPKLEADLYPVNSHSVMGAHVAVPTADLTIPGPDSPLRARHYLPTYGGAGPVTCVLPRGWFRRGRHRIS